MTAILNHGFAVVRMSICLYTDFFVKTLFFCGVKHTHMLKKHGQFMAVNIPMYSIVETKLEKIILLCIRKKCWLISLLISLDWYHLWLNIN